MIIKITFHDNDFKNVLEKIGRNMCILYSYYRLTRLVDIDDPEKIKEYCDNAKEFDKYLKMIQDEEKFTPVDKGLFLRLIIKSVKAWIEDTYPDDAKYLTDRLEIEIVDSVKDQWENGEVLYYFPMNDQYLIM